MKTEDVIIDILVKQSVDNGELTEEEISDICEERKLPISSTSFIIEKLMSKGIKITSEYPKATYLCENRVAEERNTPNSVKSDYNYHCLIEPEKDDYVDFSLKKSYSDYRPVFVKYRDELVNVGDWKEAYVKAMSMLAQNYGNKLASWSGWGDVIWNYRIPNNIDPANLIQISSSLSVVANFSDDELLHKLRKYIHVCGVNENLVKIAYVKVEKASDDQCDCKENNNPELSDNKVIAERIENIIDEKAIDNISSKVDSLEEKKTNVKERMDEFLTSFSSDIEKQITELKEKSVKLIDSTDHERSVKEFALIHKEICSLNVLKKETEKIKEQLPKLQDIDNIEVVDNSKFDGIEDFCKYLLELKQNQKNTIIDLVEKYKGKEDERILKIAMNNIAYLNSWCEKIIEITGLSRLLSIDDKSDFKRKVENKTCTAYDNCYEKNTNVDLKVAIPAKKTEIIFDDLPLEIKRISPDGKVLSLIEIYDINKETFREICISGKKSIAEDFRLSTAIGYKVYDDDDFLIESGKVLLSDVKVGEKFKKRFELYHITFGGKYRIVFM